VTIVSHSTNHHSKEAAMTFYCGINLHAKKSHICIIDKDGKKVKEESEEPTGGIGQTVIPN